MDRRPIGLLDSGVGGLTVVKEMNSVLPFEDIVYIGDTARMPYGVKGPDEVKGYVFELIDFLVDKDVKAVVIACNTATAVALEEVRQRYSIPIIGVIEPGSRAAAGTSKNNKIGLFATVATINSNMYQQIINQYNENAEIFSHPCSQFTLLVEEGIKDEEKILSAIREYYGAISSNEIDTLVLGSTHYPVLTEYIKKVVPSNVTIVNPGIETANELKRVLEVNSLLSDSNIEACEHYYTTGEAEDFKSIGEKILKRVIENVTSIAL